MWVKLRPRTLDAAGAPLFQIVVSFAVSFALVRRASGQFIPGAPEHAITLGNHGERWVPELESVCGGNSTVGSNPTATASRPQKRRFEPQARTGVFSSWPHLVVIAVYNDC